ncbi:proline-rich receptor-like protein kinase PERK15 [Senna tora]|uniref:non-specific serine/threonine protein kinase n=1 Tax=Senna tora TaxID=362788 RepID=A0A834TA67_9FABA|nr:proline-rich receptor-like protein kinase PERK15 [Senna tora]
MPPLETNPTPSPLSAPSPLINSPSSSVLPVVFPMAPLPSTSASPVNSPATLVSPVSSPPSPHILLLPASSPPIMSQHDTTHPPLHSPPTSLLPPRPSPSPVVSSASQPPPFPFPFTSAPETRFFPPTVTSRPPSTPALPKPMSPVPQITSSPPPVIPFVTPFVSPPPSPLPIIPFTKPLPLSSSATPSNPSLPASASAPETQMPSSENSSVTPWGHLPPAPSAGVLPLAVEVEKPPAFNMSTGLGIGLVIGGAILFAFVLAIVSFLCVRRRHRRKKNLDLLQPSHSVGSKESHIIGVEANPMVTPYLREGGVGSCSVKSEHENPIPNHAPPSIGFGSVNGVFAYEELVVATSGFSEAKLLGQGGFGFVYKGVLPSGKEIAVKKLKSGSEQGDREFQAEVETISRVHHKHLVELVGYCVTTAERLLVYEFVPNDTLESHLHGEGKPIIEWATRIKIALGSARGLAYLHEDFKILYLCAQVVTIDSFNKTTILAGNPAIIHRDIKASNILLDFKFDAKVSDFGLAKIFPNTDSCVTHLTTRVETALAKTAEHFIPTRSIFFNRRRYLAPEYASSGKLTDKSDVYSFGVMLLELITGRPPITATESSRNQSLVDWARPLLAQALQDGVFSDLVDPRLQKNYREDEMARMITCAAACVHHSARLRPRMSQIVGALEGVVSLADFVEDIRTEYTKVYSWSGSSNYDANKYQEDIRNFNMALSSQKYSFSACSESTSAYGLHPSDSSSEDSNQIKR